MTISYEFLGLIQSQPSHETWKSIFDFGWDTCSAAFGTSRVDSEVTRRDRLVADLDLFLATAAWDLWESYEQDVPRTSNCLVDWWNSNQEGKAILILDALSLRETPWILEGARRHGFTIRSSVATGSELPADTTAFAKALGFGHRSSLSNDSASKTHAFKGAKTEATELPWKDCSALIGAEKSWVFWHHWPDHRLHDHDEPGKGLSTLTKEVEENLTSEDFWEFVERLCKGRRLVITADHGYAASGLFPDSNKEQTEYLKEKFRSGRFVQGNSPAGDWVSPIDISLTTEHGTNLFVLGRRKWKSTGGYPTLTHGGLSLLEVAVPFIELTK